VWPYPRTLVVRDHITAFTCEVAGDAAKGSVRYEVANLYRGKFDYVATRSGGSWEISELSMPARKIHLVRNEDGDWTAK
jgi:hypothetical protein